MRLVEALAKYVDTFEYREPGPKALELLSACRSRRSFCLSDLPWTRKDCAWCNARRVRSSQAKYCGSDCVESAMLYCNPQFPASKAWRFVVDQGAACKGCGEDFEHEVVTRILRAVVRINGKNYIVTGKIEKVPFYSIGYGTGHLWQVDHVVPIFKGGRGIGMDNVQVLCVPCHERKTIEERRSPCAKPDPM